MVLVMHDTLFDQCSDIAFSRRKELRDHQVKAIGLVRQSLGRGNRRVVLQGSVGFGKTLVSARIIEASLEKGNPVLFTAPAISLIDQTVAAFEAEGLRGIGVMQSNHPRTDRAARIQVASVQTLARRDIPRAPLIIVDECHLCFDVIYKLMDARPDAFFVGLSATPWAKGMGRWWQDLVIPTTISELIDGGFLSQFRVFAPYDPDLSAVKIVAGDYHEGQLAEIMGEGKLVGSVVETWLRDGEDRPTLCFAVNRAHAANLEAGFKRAGISSAYVDANTDRVERGVIGRRFASGEIRVICSVRTMTTGVDLPVSCIVDAAPTKSPILHVQKIGRGMRVNVGTEDLKILDHAGNSLRIGLVTDIAFDHLDETEKGKQERSANAKKLPKPCSSCGVLHAEAICPSCGRARRAVAGVETVDGELVELGSGKRKMVLSGPEKRLWWAGLLRIARTRGRSRGWAAHAYKEKTGVWPRGLPDVEGDATQEMWNYVKAKDIRWAKSRAKNVS